MRTWLILSLVGCYAPTTPSGAYLCSADSTCPKGQQCVCDLCVNRVEDAACKFSVDATVKSSVAEHESFSVTIKALQKNGTPATGFHNTVTLSFALPDGSPWCDVTPSTVTLTNGVATVPVTLNRETIPPQKPKLRAVFATSLGDSAGIEVKVPPFTKDLAAIVPPATKLNPFGWADAVVAEPAILHDATGFRMYFLGYQANVQTGIGVATSTDGRSFTPRADPVFKPAAGSWYSGAVLSPAPFFSQKGVSLGFTGTQASLDLTPPGQIGIASSPDGLSNFAVAASLPVLKNGAGMQMADCDYCTDSLDFSQVIDQPSQITGDAGLGGKLMFFSAQSQSKIAAIGRASSSDDGATWVAEPAPVLSGDIGGEAVLLSPHVLVDGTVFKMWYSFARLGDVLKNPLSLCDIPIDVGYATSTDGFYWVRSPSNPRAPAVTKSVNGWDAGLIGFVVGSVIPVDGEDASKGIALYYTTWRHLNPNDATSTCLANGIGRSTRM